MVSVRGPNTLWFDCTPRELKVQLAYFEKRGFEFVGTQTIVEHVRTRTPFKRPTVCITFADNYEGFFLLAWPILKSKRVPVTMFVHTGHVGSRKGRPKMSWTQLQVLSKSTDFKAASQTVSHPADLTKLNARALLTEFVKSRRDLMRELSSGYLDFVAYPNGKFDFRVSQLAKAAGYDAGFTEVQRPVDESPDIMRIPRYVHTKFKVAARDALVPIKSNGK
jgi:peptidoglycan/xylan/chitin deacetylase (PgdA/CDA1 family)